MRAISNLLASVVHQYQIHAASLALVSRGDGGLFHLYSLIGDRFTLSIIPFGDGSILARAINSRDPVYRQDIGRVGAAEPLWPNGSVLSDCIIPLVAAGVCFGTLNIGSQRKDRFPAEKRQPLQTIAAIIAVVLPPPPSSDLDDYRLLRSLVAINPDLIFFKDRDFRYRLANPAFCHFLGKSEEEILGRTDNDLLLPEEAATCRQGDLQALTSRQRFEGDELAHSAQGERWVHFVKVPVPDGEDEFQGILGVARDVTDRKELEQKLLEANTHLQERVARRTAALETTNKKLCREVEERQMMLADLAGKTKELEELNVALRILMAQGNKAKKEVQDNVISNIDSMIIPALNDLQLKLAGTREEAAILQIRRHIEQITSSFSRDLATKGYNFSPREMQIADLVRQGKTNKEISSLLNLSAGTIQLYRDRIRSKLGIKKRRVNLVSFLRSLLRDD